MINAKTKIIRFDVEELCQSVLAGDDRIVNYLRAPRVDTLIVDFMYKDLLTE